MEALWTRYVENIIGRLDGPLHFRFIVQPAVAAVLAFFDGLRDARAGRAPYLWMILTAPAHRRDLLREGWQAVLKVFIVACILDLTYQLWVLHALYLDELLLVAFMLAIAPYLLIRGPVNLLARPWLRRSAAKKRDQGGRP